MKQVSLLFLSWFLAAFSYKAMAQDDSVSPAKKGTEEIVIRKKDGKEINMTIQITGDKIMINGKPLIEFKDDHITIYKRNITVWNNKNSPMPPEGMGNFDMDNYSMHYNGGSKVVLGVNTQKSEEGAMITEITKGSAAEKAGLQNGDIITKLGDEKIEDSKDLYEAVNKKKIKEEVKIEFKRAGKEKSVKTYLQERKENSYGLVTPGGMYKSYTIPKMPDAQAYRRFRRSPPENIDENMIENDINGAMDFAFSFGRPKLGLKIQDTEEGNGVKVLSIEENSSSAKAGMKADDLIIQVGDDKIKNTDDMREALQDNESKSDYKIKAKRNGKEMNFDIKIPKKLKTANL